MSHEAGLDPGFLHDPFTFRQCCEVLGTSSLAHLMQSKLPEGRKVGTALFRVPDALDDAFSSLAANLADKIVRDPKQARSTDLLFGFGATLSSTFEESLEALASGGTLMFLGYCGPRHGPSEDEILTVKNFIASLPSELLNGAADVPARLNSLVYHGCGTIEGKIEAHCRDVTTVDLGGLLTYPLWAATAGHMPYARDEQVAFPLMAQVIERRLMKYRILGAGMKFIVGRKS